MSGAALSAGWRPRSLHSAKLRRPAPTEGPTALAAGWRLHRGEPEPGEDDKIPPTAALPKVAWARQDRQRQGTRMTQATSRLNQSASKSLPHERIRGKGEGICLQDAGPRGERHFIKLPPSDEESEARRSRRRCSHRGAGSRAAGHLTYNQTPTYIRGSGPLD
jgi:hypothetical protein